MYDNIFVERFWRTVNYEEVYLREYRTVAEARAGLAANFRFYNEERFHEALGYRTPHEVYFGTPARLMPTAETVVLTWTDSRSSLPGFLVRSILRPS